MENLEKYDEITSVRTIPGDLLVTIDRKNVRIALEFDENSTFRTIELMTRPE